MVIVSGLAVLILAALVAAGARAPDYPADSPEGAFQRYYRAWTDGDYDAAYDYFSSGVRARLTRECYVQLADGWGGGGERVVLSSTTVSGNRADLMLRIEYGGGPFGGRWSEERTVRLVHEEGSWRLVRAMMGLWEADDEMIRFDCFDDWGEDDG